MISQSKPTNVAMQSAPVTERKIIEVEKLEYTSDVALDQGFHLQAF